MGGLKNFRTRLEAWWQRLREAWARRQAQRAPRLGPQEAYQLLQSRKRDPNFVVLDVRTGWEFREVHLPGARHLDYYARDFRRRLEGLDRSKAYLVYCRTGRRSARVARLMLRMGFQEVYDLRGGLMAWSRARLPLRSGAREGRRRK